MRRKPMTQDEQRAACEYRDQDGIRCCATCKWFWMDWDEDGELDRYCDNPEVRGIPSNHTMDVKPNGICKHYA